MCVREGGGDQTRADCALHHAHKYIWSNVTLARSCDNLHDPLSKDRVELLGDVAVFVIDGGLAQSDDDVGVSLAIDVCRVKVIGLNANSGHTCRNTYLYSTYAHT